MRPGGLQSWFILFWIKFCTIGTGGGGQGSEEVHGEHVDNLQNFKVRIFLMFTLICFQKRQSL